MHGAYRVITASVEVSLTLLGVTTKDFSPGYTTTMVMFEGKEFYLDQTYIGKLYEGNSTRAKPVIGHHYLDKSRKFWIRVYKLPNSVVAYIGEEIAPESITEILPFKTD
jgi:hypothetical protein